MTLFDCFYTARIAAAAVLLVVISVKDVRTRRIPGRLILLLAAASLLRIAPFITAKPADGSGALRVIPAVLPDMLLGGAGTLLLLLALTHLADRLLGRETLGGGDIRLAAALGLHLGLYSALLMLLAASLLALPEAVVRRRKGEPDFPFAPYLAAAGWVMIILRAAAE